MYIDKLMEDNVDELITEAQSMAKADLIRLIQSSVDDEIVSVQRYSDKLNILPEGEIKELFKYLLADSQSHVDKLREALKNIKLS